MSNSGKWSPVTFDELQAGDRVQVKRESVQETGAWTQRTITQGEFVLGSLESEGWYAKDDPSQLVVLRSPRANIKQTILRYVPPFEFPTKLGTVFTGLHYEEGRHTFVVADYLSDTDLTIYRNVTDSFWQDASDLTSQYSDFRLGEV